jgi:microcompartment protein CcmL/EutN
VAQESIGLIETRGLVAAVGAADVAVKAGHVSLLPFELIGGGLVSVKFSGDVAAVNVALQAGVEAAQVISKLVSHNVIPAPDVAISQIFFPDGITLEENEKNESFHDLSVTQLRQLVRQRSDSKIKGRDVSRANKQTLIEELQGHNIKSKE